MTYHPSLLKNKTRDQIMSATQSQCEFAEWELLKIEQKALRLILQGEPPRKLKATCEKRLIEVSLKLGALTEAEALRLTRNVLRAMAL